jgi:hypothetical protein
MTRATRIFPRTTALLLLGAGATLSLAARAEEGATLSPRAAAETAAPSEGCPPGAYCEALELEPPHAQPAEPAIVPSDPTAGTTITIPPAPAGSDPSKPRVVVIRPGQNGEPDQVIVYDQGEPPAHALPPAPPAKPPSAHPSPEHPRRKKVLRRHRGWGLGLRAEGAMLSQQHEHIDSFGMGGIGMSLRYRPVRGFALDFGADVIGGTDPNGWSRQEVPLSASALLYLNPRSSTQFYVLGGAHLAFARVGSDFKEPNLAAGNSDAYSYAGGQVGVGVEFRMSPLIGVHFDGLAFFRGRTDDDGNGRYPEFYDASAGLVSNSSAGGLMRAGVNFWW